MKSHLFISPYFPPMTDAGVKRSVHLVRNLPAFGWRPVVLASRAVNEPEDFSLLDAVPRETIVSYGYSGVLRPLLKRLGQTAGSLIRSRARDDAKSGRDWTFLTPFDRWIADTPAGIREGLRLIRQHDLRAIHVSADPWSGLLAGHWLHRLTGLPLVVDLRDPWSTHPGKIQLYPEISRRWLRTYEERLFRAAARVVLNTEASREAYVESYRGRIPEQHFVCIRNAFERELFLDGEPPKKASGFTLLYFGTFRKFVGPEELLRGFARFVEREGIERGEARLLVVGGLGPEHRARASQLGLDGYIEVHRPVPFRESLPLLSIADALALVVEPACHLQIPGKFYDYLAIGRPILAISANAEINRIIAELGAGLTAGHGDPEDVADRLATLCREMRDGRPRQVPADALENFTAREQARLMARVLDEAIAR